MRGDMQHRCPRETEPKRDTTTERATLYQRGPLFLAKKVSVQTGCASVPPVQLSGSESAPESPGRGCWSNFTSSPVIWS